MEGLGPYRGQPLDRSSRRSLRFVTDPAEGIQLGPDDRVVSDFYHLGEFWTAVIPVDSVRDVYGQAFNFSRPRMRKNKHGYQIVYDRSGLPKRSIGLMNHVQSRFVLSRDRPARLFAAEQSITDAPAHLVDDFVYSVEAVGPKGVKFNLKDGYRGYLACAHRFSSTEEMVFERIVLEGQYVTQSPPLDLTLEEKKNLLLRSLERSDRAGMTEPYYLFRFCGTNNCTSNPFQVLDEVVQYTFWERVGSMVFRLPLNPRFYLWVRGLDSDPTQRKLVREEFESYIAAVETRQRKRAFLKQRKRERRNKND